MTRKSVATMQTAAPHRAFAPLFRVLGRRNCLLVVGSLVTLVLALNLDELAVAGVPPLLLSILPCLAMCALGLCKKGGNESARCAKADHATGAPTSDEVPTTLITSRGNST
jgi:hypothetical protein